MAILRAAILAPAATHISATGEGNGTELALIVRAYGMNIVDFPYSLERANITVVFAAHPGNKIKGNVELFRNFLCITMRMNYGIMRIKTF